MNNYVIVFSAIIVAAAAGSISRETGWGTPAIPQVELLLDGALSSSGSGAAQANQQLAESASGDDHVPATILSFNIIGTFVEETAQTGQISNVNFAHGLTNTAQIVDDQQTVAAEDFVAAEIVGSVEGHFSASAETDAAGEGQLIVTDSTANHNNYHS